MRMTIRQGTHDKLRYAQELLSHQVPAGDLAALLDQLLDIAIPRLEQRKFAATEQPRSGGRPRAGERTQKLRRPGAPRATPATRHVPADVRRAVWERDQGQCTFVSESGRRCSARRRIEFDHVQEVARGGDSRGHAVTMPRAQPIRSRAHIRRRVHATQARCGGGGSGRGGRASSDDRSGAGSDKPRASASRRQPGLAPAVPRTSPCRCPRPRVRRCWVVPCVPDAGLSQHLAKAQGPAQSRRYP